MRRSFASPTLDRNPGKILYGGAEQYYMSKVESGEMRNDSNQVDLLQQLEAWGDDYLAKEK
jgi:hypothetical protein